MGSSYTKEELQARKHQIHKNLATVRASQKTLRASLNKPPYGFTKEMIQEKIREANDVESLLEYELSRLGLSFNEKAE